MSVTRYKRGFKLDAAGDTIEDKIIVRRIYMHGGSAAGDMVFKDQNGNIIPPTYNVGTDSEVTVEYPFGNHLLDGFELDSVGTGGSVELLID